MVAACDQAMARLEEHIAATKYELQPMIWFIELNPCMSEDKAAIVRADRTCDGCGEFIGPKLRFHGGLLFRQTKAGTPVHISFGVCGNCADDIHNQ